MDNNFEIDREAENPTPAPQKPRKESPFADSPYVMDETPAPQEEAPGTWTPEEPEDDPNNWQFSQPADDEPAPKKPRGRIWKSIVAAVLVIALVAAACYGTACYINGYWSNVNLQNQQAMAQLNDRIEDLQQQIKDNSYTGNGNSISGSVNTSPDGLTPGQVYARNVRSVVAIINTVTSNIYGQVSESSSSGSGFILSADGYVVTNYHVIQGATSLTVITSDETQYPAEVIGYDASNDIALLKVAATGLFPVTLGSSDDLIVGDQVVAIGNPLGTLTSTLTVGYVSAKDRIITTEGAVINMIQTDAAINSGNSGGPLFNMKGEVIGITTAKYTGTSGSGATIEGIGFAIPMDDVAKKLTDLKEHGYITGAYLGIMVHDMDAETAEYFNMPLGAYVKEVTPGYCAEAAGLKAKDIIIGLGEYDIENMNDLSRALQEFKPGDTTVIVVWRSGLIIDLPITLDERPRETAQDPTVPDTDGQQGKLPSNGSYEEWWDYFFGN